MLSTATSRIMSSLFEAARDGNLNLLKQQITNGADYDQTNAEGLTAMNLAVQAGHSAIVEYLLRKKAKTRGAVIDAVIAGHPHIVKILLENGAQTEERAHTQTALMWTAYKGDQDMAAILLAAGANPNAIDNEGTTALMFAAMYNHEKVIEHLLAHGAEVNVQEASGHTALSYAVGDNAIGIVKRLLDKGAIVDIKTKANTTPLGLALSYNLTEIAILLLRQAVEASCAKPFEAALRAAFEAKDVSNALLEVVMKSGNAIAIKRLLAASNESLYVKALNQASKAGDKEIVKLLLEIMPAIDQPRIVGLRPLNFAVQEGHIEIIKLLLAARGSDELYKQAIILTDDTVRAAVAHGHLEILEILLAAETDAENHHMLISKAFGTAIADNHIEIVKCLLAKKADAPIIDTSILIEAAYAGHKEIFELLLATQTDTADSKDRVIDAALYSGHKEIVDLLLEKYSVIAEHYGALISALQGGNSAIFERILAVQKQAVDLDKLLREAASYGSTKIVALLLGKGANVYKLGWDGLNALMCAVAPSNHSRDPELVKLLLDHGADVNAQTASGMTALHFAIGVDASSTKIVKQLLTAGAKVDAINYEGKTPLMRLMRPHWDCGDGPGSCYCHVPERQAKAKLLFEHGADLYIKDYEGKTAIDYAFYKPEFQKWLIKEYAWHRRRHAVCFYAQRRNLTNTAVTTSLLGH